VDLPRDRADPRRRLNTGVSLASKNGILKSKRGTMKYGAKLSLVVGFCMSLPALAQAEAKTFRIGGNSQSRATFVSDAPLETMTGKTNKVTGTLTVDPADITQAKGSFKVSVKSLDTGNDLRDEHLQGDGWLDAKNNPFIHFEITEVVLGKKGSVELKQGKETRVEVRGNFTAHGITKPVTATGRVKWSGDQIQIKADFPVKLTDHDISVPSIVRLKVANDIAVSVDLRGVAQ
jgi:polyisoprenoid-binding protein YceI